VMVQRARTPRGGLPTTVGQLMTRPVHTCRSEDSLKARGDFTVFPSCRATASSWDSCHSPMSPGESKREESHVARAASVTAEAVGDTVAVISEPRTGHREVVPVG